VQNGIFERNFNHTWRNEMLSGEILSTELSVQDVKILLALGAIFAIIGIVYYIDRKYNSSQNDHDSKELAWQNDWQRAKSLHP